VRKKKTIYLAGPMSGFVDYNYAAFEKSAAELEDMGWAVHNPATSYNGSTRLPYHLYMTTAINLLLLADAIALMDGWQDSKGATMEALVAQRLDLPFYNAHTGRPMTIGTILVALPQVIEDGARPWPKNETLIRQLVPIARELASGNKDGITVSDVRQVALERGILTGNEHRNQLSCLGQVCRRAGLVSLGTTRRSDLEVTHGIHQTVWFEDLAA